MTERPASAGADTPCARPFFLCEPATDAAPARGAGAAAYTPPQLVRLGGWSALTLQQSVPIFP